MNSERLERLEASHIKLMTEHELAVKANDEAWEKNRIAWDKHFAWLDRFEADRKKEQAQRRESGEELDRRIAALVSAVGALIAKDKN
jgi:hypothetical protein